MKKGTLILVLALALVGVTGQAWAAETDTISVTVSLESVVSVSLDSNTWVIGPVAIGGAPSTSGTILATNDGNVTENFAIKASDGAGGWFLGDPAGADTFKVTETMNTIVLTTGDQPLATNVLKDDDVQLQLQYEPPTADTQGGGVDHSFTVTITASATP